MAVVVLLHGFASTSFTWRRVAAGLVDDGHSVVAPDRVRWDEPIDVPAGAVVVGHSAGCVTAVLSAAGARGLVLVSPVIDGGGPPAFVRPLMGLPGLAPLLRVGVRAAFGRAFRSSVQDRSALTPEVLAGYRDPLLAPGAMEALCALAPAPDVRGALAALSLPVEVIVGEHDRWATSLRSVPTTVIAGAGHLPQEERPDDLVAEVVRIVRSWVRAEPPTTQEAPQMGEAANDAKEAIKRDWEQTKHDLPGMEGKDLDQDADDTVKQALGKDDED